MNDSRSDSTDCRNIPHLKQIIVAVREFLLAGRQADRMTYRDASASGNRRA